MDTRHLTELLEQGPRNKSNATLDFETIIRALLTSSETPTFTKKNNNVFISIQTATYNLTGILLADIDFELLRLDAAAMDAYVNYIKHQENVTIKERIPSSDEFNSRDKNKNHHDLHYAEKIAIFLYSTNELFNEINSLLRFGYILEKYNHSKLCYKNCILTIAFASHALAKPSLDATTQYDLIRYEDTVPELNAERFQAIQTNQSAHTSEQIKANLHRGFTSTHTKNKPSIKRTKIHFTISSAQQAPGRDVSALSWHPNEDEYLITPGAQFLFFAHHTDFGTDEFKAIPVRTLLKHSAYQGQAGKLRHTLIAMTNALISDTNADMSPDHINTVIAEMHQLCQEKPADFQDLLNHLCFALSPIKLTAHANYVLKNHLSLPYTNPSIDRQLQQDERIVYRPNHGLAHSMRVALYVPAVLTYFANHALDSGFASYCKNITLEDIELIQLALLFSVAGRNDECGFNSDPVNYKKFKSRSATYFCDYAQSLALPREEIIFFSDLIENMGDPNYPKHVDDRMRYIFHIMNLAHKLDLMRCYDKTSFEIALSVYRDAAICKADHAVGLTQLFKLAHTMILATGDRCLIALAKNNELISSSGTYKFSKFYCASTNPKAVIDYCRPALLRYAPLQFLAACTPELEDDSNRQDELPSKVFLDAVNDTELNHVINTTLLYSVSSSYLEQYSELATEINEKINHIVDIDALTQTAITPFINSYKHSLTNISNNHLLSRYLNTIFIAKHDGDIYEDRIDQDIVSSNLTSKL